MGTPGLLFGVFQAPVVTLAPCRASCSNLDDEENWSVPADARQLADDAVSFAAPRLRTRRLALSSCFAAVSEIVVIARCFSIFSTSTRTILVGLAEPA